jgi:hypothetical protein
LTVEQTDARTLQAVGVPSLLVLTGGGSGNPFGGYLEEIIRTEGLRDFEVRSASELSTALLADRRVVLLGETTLSGGQVTDLTNFVTAGGGLVVMRPAANLVSLCGLASTGGTTAEGYLRISDGTIGAGLYAETMQFHGTASHYSLAGAAEVAQLYTDRASSAGRPAVAIHTVGAGRVASFAFDLAQSVVLTRQGNPANADVDRDGDGYFRSVDLYNGWIDLQRSRVPQADMQQRLLARLIDAVSLQPTPRLWYFPNTSPAVFVATGDAHANPESYYQVLVDAFSQRGVGFTFYVTTSAPPASVVNGWIAQGMDFATHPYIDNGYSSGYQNAYSTFVNRYGFTPRTARTHMVRWLGWTEAASIESQVGVEMDFNMYQWGAWLNPGPAPGYITGSGQPMRFMDANGTLLPIYGQHTNLVDEELAPEVGVAGLSLQAALDVSRQTIDDSVGGYHTVIATQFHVDYFGFGGVNPWVLQTTDYALQRGAMPLSADAWLTFVKQRATTAIANSVWANNALAFDVSPGGANQTVLLPLQFRGSSLTGAQRNGSPVSYGTLTVNSIGYAAVPASGGSYVASYAGDTTPPQISNVAVTTTSASATVTWTTDEAATRLVLYGLGSSLDQQASASGMGTSHSVTIEGLQPSTSYSYQASSTDASQNTNTSQVGTFQTAAAGAPVLNTVSPTSGPQGSSQTITLGGSGFAAGATATIGSTPLVNVVVQSPTTIQATVPASLTAGTYPITVQNPDGQSTTLANAYTVAANPPTLTSVSPGVVLAGQQITLTGTNFVTGATVRVGTTPATTSVASATSATATVPSSVSPGTYDVSIANPDGQSASLAGALTVSALPAVGHTTVADFSTGILTSTQVVSGGDAGDGAVALSSAGFSEAFADPSLDPARWANGLWQPDGSVTLAPGSLSISGAWVRSQQTITSGLVSARLTFSANNPFQNFGLSRADNLDDPWFLFGTLGSDPNNVYVRVNAGTQNSNFMLTGLVGAPHDYAIQYQQGSARFLVDGQVVREVTTVNTGALAVWLSVGPTGAPLVANSVQIASYASPGTFTSAALDAGQSANWVQFTLASTLPEASSVSARVRSSTNGSSWSGWSATSSTFPLALSLPEGRYLQYDLQLASTNAAVTPLVTSTNATYQLAGGQTISAVNVSPPSATLSPGGTQQFSATVLDGNGQPIPGAPVNWSIVNGGGTISPEGLFTAGGLAGTFTGTVVASSSGVTGSATVVVEVQAPPPVLTAINPATAAVGQAIIASGQDFVSGATVQLGTTPAEAVTVQSSQSISFVVPAGLPAATYDVTVTNPNGQFSTLAGALTVTTLSSIGHTTVADFSAGTLTNTQASSGGSAGDGAVTLATTGFSDAFVGSSLDSARWSSGLWQADGSVTVASNSLTLTGGWARTQQTITAGFVTARLIFGTGAFQNFGLSRADNLDDPWFLFGTTSSDPNNVYVRVNAGTQNSNFMLPGLVGGSHDYTIQYQQGLVRFLVDGQLVREVTSVNTGALAAWLSVGPTGPQLVSTFFEIGSYASSGSFLSAPLDAGASADWSQLAITQGGTAGSVTARVRSSWDAAAWSPWSATSSSFPFAVTAPDGRYLQYELQLSTTDSSTSPIVTSVTATFQPGGSPPTAGSVVVTPSAATVGPGDTQQFSAQVLDGQGQPLPGATVSWSVVNGGGSVDGGGLFTAGSTPGTYTNTVVAESGGVSGAASVTVEADPAPTLSGVSPATASVGQSVTLSGANFVTGASVTIGTTPATNVSVSNAQTATFTVPAGTVGGTYDVTLTNPDGQSGTLAGALTVQVVVAFSQSTAADFSGGVYTGTMISAYGDGEIRLLPAFQEEFGGAQLDTGKWASGTFGSPNTLSVAGGALTVSNAWVHSQAQFGAVTFTARATFNIGGQPYAHLGFGAPGTLDVPWFLFSVPSFNTNYVYCRTNTGSFYRETRVPLDPAVPHEYSIQRLADRIVYRVDGQRIVTHTVTSPSNTAPLPIWASSSRTGQSIVVDWLRVDQYPTTGTYRTITLDGGQSRTWGTISGDFGLPSGTRVRARIRTSSNGTSWGGWSSNVTLGTQPVAVGPRTGRYLQIELTLTGSGTTSPEVRSLSIQSSS